MGSVGGCWGVAVEVWGLCEGLLISRGCYSNAQSLKGDPSKTKIILILFVGQATNTSGKNW